MKAKDRIARQLRQELFVLDCLPGCEQYTDLEFSEMGQTWRRELQPGHIEILTIYLTYSGRWHVDSRALNFSWFSGAVWQQTVARLRQIARLDDQPDNRIRRIAREFGKQNARFALADELTDFSESGRTMAANYDRDGWNQTRNDPDHLEPVEIVNGFGFAALSRAIDNAIFLLETSRPYTAYLPHPTI